MMYNCKMILYSMNSEGLFCDKTVHTVPAVLVKKSFQNLILYETIKTGRWRKLQSRLMIAMTVSLIMRI